LAVDAAAFAVALGAMVAALFVFPGVVAGSRWWVVPLYLVIPTALLWRRRLPLAVSVVVSVPIAVQAVATGQPSEGLHLVWPVAVALYSLGAFSSYRRVAIGVAVVVAAMTIHDVNDTQSIFHDGQSSEWAWAFWLLVEVAVILLGVWVGAQRRQHRLIGERAAAEQAAAARTQAAIEAERARIARELHDVVTHNVNVVVLQAMAASGVIDSQPQRARAPLAAIEASGREALIELRRLFGILYDGYDGAADGVPPPPAPGLRTLPDLIEGVCRAGVDADLDVAGDVEGVPAAVGLAVYRVTQEALTNVLKHAPGSRATVRVHCRADAVEMEISDCGGAAHTHDLAPGTGRGLAGMRERVTVFGGQLVTGPRADGGFGVWARLPLRVGDHDR
jgi:signal transduction histidine kinase